MLLLYIILYIIYNSKLFSPCFAHRNMLNDTLWRWDDVADSPRYLHHQFIAFLYRTIVSKILVIKSLFTFFSNMNGKIWNSRNFFVTLC